jgi:hypothetical protein
MEVKTVTYVKVLGTFRLGFAGMDSHMADMMSEGWNVVSQSLQPGRSFSLGVTPKPDNMIVTYAKQ